MGNVANLSGPLPPATFVCAVCGTPMEISASEARKFPLWEEKLGAPLVVAHILCPAPPLEVDA